MPEVFMPRLSDTMQEGTVSAWTKSVGDRVEKGDVLAEIETDKATMELEAYDAGRARAHRRRRRARRVPIGEVIAVIGDGSGAGKGGGTGAALSAGEATPAAPAAEAPPEPPVSAAGDPQRDARRARGRPGARGGRRLRRRFAAASVNGSAGKAVKASPLARAMARDAGLDLSTVRGSGPGGRIVRADVQQAIAALRRRAARRPADARAAVRGADRPRTSKSCR